MYDSYVERSSLTHIFCNQAVTKIDLQVTILEWFNGTFQTSRRAVDSRCDPNFWQVQRSGHFYFGKISSTRLPFWQSTAHVGIHTSLQPHTYPTIDGVMVV